jgi:two-component system KDP operon response regulator KdpE
MNRSLVNRSLVSLLIDEDVGIRRLLRVTLESNTYRVVEAANGRDGLVQAARYQPDAVLLDLDLPDIGGLEILRHIREWSRVPVLILSVRDREQDKIAALDAGANDYLTKPFHIGELLARLRAVLRNDRRHRNKPFYRRGSFEVDLVARDVRKNGERIKLTRTEYALLQLLVTHAGKVLTHRQILTEVWGQYAAKATHYLRVYVAHLRGKIESNRSSPEILFTESGAGYRLAEDCSETSRGTDAYDCRAPLKEAI